MQKGIIKVRVASRQGITRQDFKIRDHLAGSGTEVGVTQRTAGKTEISRHTLNTGAGPGQGLGVDVGEAECEGPRPRGGGQGGGLHGWGPRHCKLVAGAGREARALTTQQRHRLGSDARAGRGAPTAPLTSASISAIFAKVPLMVARARGGAGRHTTWLPSRPDRATDHRGKAQARDLLTLATLFRERSAPRRTGPRRSPPAPPTPPRSSSQCGVIEPAAALTRAVARAGLLERAGGRAQLGPTPPGRLRAERAGRQSPRPGARQSACGYFKSPFLIGGDAPGTSASQVVESPIFSLSGKKMF